MQSFKRSVRVGELILQELSKIVQQIRQMGTGFITLTSIKLTDDLQDARIFYSVLGTPEEIEKSKEAMEENTKYIRQQLASMVSLRRIPTLVFEFDNTPEKANKIFELLEKIKTEGRQETPVVSRKTPKGVRKKKKAPHR